MRLGNSKNLIRTPDFSGMPYLEELDLGGCTRLRDIHPTLLLHKKVVSLNLKDCTSLTTLPGKIFMESLKILVLSGCLNLKNFPEIGGSMKCLSELLLDGTDIKEVPILPFELLPGLVRINLEDCKRLQSMPQLPPNIEEVRVDGCVSLETLSGALKLCNSEYISINCIDDLKLLGNNGLAFSMLKEYLEVILSLPLSFAQNIMPKNDAVLWTHFFPFFRLQVVSNPIQKFCIVVPGSEIPEWFMHQNDGSSIKFIMPSNLYCKNKALGYAVCCVFHVQEHSLGIQMRSSYLTHRLNCHMNGSSTSYFIEFREKFAKAESDHLWLLYLSLQKCYYINWGFENNLIELSFRPVSGPGLEVKRCGFHPIYRHKVEFFNQTRNQLTHYTTYNVNEFYPDSVGSKLLVATMSK